MSISATMPAVDYGFGRAQPATLNELVTLRARTDPEQIFVRHLADADQDEQLLTYARLARRSGQIAALLAARGLTPGERVLLILPTGLHFIEAFFGILAAGMVPVPAYPPARLARLEHYLRTLSGIVDTASCSAAIIDRQLLPLVGARLAEPGLTLFSEADLELASCDPAPIAALEPSSAAFLQFTSGTTSRPRGVLLHQAQVVAQLRSYAETTGQAPGKVAVSWLPLYHDLGLIGKVFACLYARMELVLLSPVAFLKQPICWLRAISRHGASHTVAPNFAYSLCVRKCPPALLDAEQIDLSSLEIMGMGGESVSMATIDAFRQAFVPYGLRPEILCPCYGLAENTLGATGHRAGEATRSLTVSRSALQEGRVAEAQAPADAWTLPSNGRAMPDMRLRIVDASGQQLGNRGIGEIWIQGPSVAAGYFNDGEATRQAFVDHPDGRWLRTGDLGFLGDAGDLFICGRRKDMMIVRGRNYHPQDLEQVAGDVPGVRTGNVVAFATTVDDEERAVLVCEFDDRTGRALDEVRSDVRAAVNAAFELALADVPFVPRGSVPKTSSGKLQRGLLREAYEGGALARFAPPGPLARLRLGARLQLSALRQRLRRADRPDSAAPPTPAGPPPPEVLDPRIAEAMLQAAPTSTVQLSPRLRLDALGLDSLARQELWLAVEALYGARVPEDAWGWSQTLGDVQRLAEQYEGAGPVGDAAGRKTGTPLFVRRLLEEPGTLGETYQPPVSSPAAFGLVSLISRTCWGLEIQGEAHLPREGGFILAGNHLTYLDGAWVRRGVPRAQRERMIAMSWTELDRNPALGWFLSLIETIAVNPEKSFVGAMQSGLAALALERILLIFPEGQRSHTGQLDTFRPGVGLLSLLSGCPIVPFRLDNAFEIYPRHRTLPRFLRWRQRKGDRLGLTFAPPIQPPRHAPDQTWDQARSLVAELRAAVAAC